MRAAAGAAGNTHVLRSNPVPAANRLRSKSIF
jgi:hypothetical protein